MFRAFALTFFLVALAGSTGANAQVAAASLAQAKTVLAEPLSLLRTADMQFGSLIVTTGGAATIDPQTGALTVTGGLIPGSGPVSPARFIGAASRLSLVVIRIPGGSVALRRQGGTETLTASNFSLDRFPIMLVSARAFEFAVGARLTVPAGTMDGVYSGDLDVTVEYY